MSLKPIKIYGGGRSPNPVKVQQETPMTSPELITSKVAIMLEELNLPFDVTGAMDWKSESYLAINPNGRAPSIEDPNTGVIMFESCAIIEYLIETYDKDNKFTYTTSPEKWLQKSFLWFQGSGQGPYYGQAGWFQFIHAEKLPSAIERYQNEAKRVCGVLDAHLKKQGSDYLIGEKVTCADLAWLGWNLLLDEVVVPGWDYAADYPTFGAWHQRLIARPAVKKVVNSPDWNYVSKH